MLAAVLLLAGAAAVAGAAWYGRPLYERYVKTDWIVDPAGGGDTRRSRMPSPAPAPAPRSRSVRAPMTSAWTIERPVNLVPAVPEDAP